MQPEQKRTPRTAEEILGEKLPVKTLRIFTIDHGVKGAEMQNAISGVEPVGRAHHRIWYLPKGRLLEVSFYPPGAEVASETRHFGTGMCSFVLA